MLRSRINVGCACYFHFFLFSPKFYILWIFSYNINVCASCTKYYIRTRRSNHRIAPQTNLLYIFYIFRTIIPTGCKNRLALYFSFCCCYTYSSYFSVRTTVAIPFYSRTKHLSWNRTKTFFFHVKFVRISSDENSSIGTAYIFKDFILF